MTTALWNKHNPQSLTSESRENGLHISFVTQELKYGRFNNCEPIITQLLP